VSHYWGTPFSDFVSGIRGHAVKMNKSEGGWECNHYWICTFSNNQWNLGDEIGKDWMQCSFYLALRCGHCMGTAMVLDEDASALGRSWCLFELLQTFQLTQDREVASFRDFWLCTKTGVLNLGHSSTDAALAIARRVANLRLQDATASVLADKELIDGLISSQPGGFDVMNAFVKHHLQGMLADMKRSLKLELDSLENMLLADEVAPPLQPRAIRSATTTIITTTRTPAISL
ncbi:unnamed protein product, partial [Polarella glacialis]